MSIQSSDSNKIIVSVQKSNSVQRIIVGNFIPESLSSKNRTSALEKTKGFTYVLSMKPSDITAVGNSEIF